MNIKRIAKLTVGLPLAVAFNVVGTVYYAAAYSADIVHDGIRHGDWYL